jgi:hypothetical protein
MPQKEFEQLVADALSAAHIPFRRQVDFGGLRTDFLVSTPKGRLIAIESLSNVPIGGPRGDSGGWRTLLNRSNYYKGAIGADRVLFAIKGLKSSEPTKGIVNVKDVARVVAHEIELDERDMPNSAVSSWRNSVMKGNVKEQESETVFAAMPFAPKYEDTFFGAMVPAAKSVDAVCVRVDQEKFQGDVVKEIFQLITNARAMIVDVSEPNPNVFLEAGYGLALKVPIVQISSAPTQKLPFDIRNFRTIKYVKGQTHKLVKPLADELQAIWKTDKLLANG